MVDNHSKKKHHSNSKYFQFVERKSTTTPRGHVILLIPKNTRSIGTSRSWLREMYTQFKQNKELSALGSQVIYKTDPTDPNSVHYLYSAGLDVAYTELDTPVLFHRYNGLNEKDKRVQATQTNINGEFGSVTAVSRYGMMVRNEPQWSWIFHKKQLNELLSDTHDTNLDHILCLTALTPTIGTNHIKIMYHPIQQHAFMVDHVKPSTNEDYIKSPIKQPKIRDDKLIRIMKRIMDIKLGEFKNTRIAWDFGAGSCTGWFMEAVNFVTALENHVPIRIITGKQDMCDGLPGHVLSSLHRLIDRTFASITIFVTHKPPERYPFFPYNGLVNIPGLPDYVVGRSMYESTTIPDSWSTHCDKVDEVWVPGHFLMDAFVRGGIQESKVRFMPEPIDHQGGVSLRGAFNVIDSVL